MEFYPAKLESQTLMFKFLKRKKQIPDQLDKALAFGLITKEELLRLRLERAEQTYKDFLKKDTKK